MKLSFNHIFTLFAGLLASIIVPAQDIPLMQKDPAIVNGVLPNGMSYYLVSNPATKGVADFALIQKTGRLTDPAGPGKAEALAQEAFLSLSRLNPGSVSDYMARHGVIPGEDGFAKVIDDATIYEFNRVRLDLTNAVDSTLLIIMDIADRTNYQDDCFLKKWYSPEDQAVIVSGDISPSAVAAKLTSISYMIPKRESAGRPEYMKKSGDKLLTVSDAPGNLKTITAEWTSKRAPRKYMNTVQPEIFELALNTMGAAAAERLERCMEEMNVPVADVSYGHACSSEYPYDDFISLSISVRAEDADVAKDAMAAVMSSMDSEGITTDEFLIAEASYILNLTEKSARPVKSNREYVEICKNAFLYNSALSSTSERLAYHTSRELPDTMRRRLFNGIAAAVIDTLWAADRQIPQTGRNIDVPDTLIKPMGPVKVKLKSIRKEPVSGGSIWTFSNGFKVIYRKMASDRMYYSLALNGGYGNIEGLNEGEGAFVSDYLKTCRISGMDGKDFFDFLKINGLTMDINVSLSNMMISGSLPDSEMPLMLRALLAIADERVEDGDKFDYYRECEYLALDMAQGSQQARMTAIDSIMCPDYRYSPYKTKGKIADGFPARAKAYYDGMFAKMNDGVLILAGDMNEEKLKKILLEYAGHFHTFGNPSKRTNVHYQPVSGWSTYTVEGAEKNVDIAFSTRLPFTMDNYLAAEIASEVIRQELAGLGVYFSLSSNCRIYPEERLNIMVTFPGASLETLSGIRSAIADLQSPEISGEDLKTYKDALKGRLSREMKSPDYWMHAIALRYLDNKDLTTGWQAKVDAVTPEKVREILSLVEKGCKIEYVTL